jgi:hypothetical protein
MRAGHAIVAALGLSLAACAGGGGYDNKQPFNVWVEKIDHECTYASIGSQQVGWLIDSVGSNQGMYFMDQMERMFNGTISPQRFTSDVTGFLGGKASDPGIECILGRLPAARPKPQIY